MMEVVYTTVHAVALYCHKDVQQSLWEKAIKAIMFQKSPFSKSSFSVSTLVYFCAALK